MFKKSNIFTNFYPFILWDISVFGNKKKELPSNIYEKEAELSFNQSEATFIKTDLIESSLVKANVLEVIILKYLPIGLLCYFMVSFNLFYPSMVGLCIASFVYVVYSLIKAKISNFFAYMFLLSLFVTYIMAFINNFNGFLFFNINNIGNYVIQYFVWLWLLERLFIDIYTLNFLNMYKIKELYGTFLKIKSTDFTEKYTKKRKTARLLFGMMLILLASFTFVLGGVDLWRKYEASKVVTKELLLKENNIQQIIKQRNADALQELLNNQSREVGINKHSSASQLKLLHEDFEKYVSTQPISYEKIRLGASTILLNLETKEVLNPPRAAVVRSWVQKYEAAYRWHIEPKKGTVYVIISAKAR